MNLYYQGLKEIKQITLPASKDHNASIFYFTCVDLDARTDLLYYLRQTDIPASFHYQALHKSAFAGSGSILPNSEKYSDTLIRLPLYVELSEDKIQTVISIIKKYFNNSK